jgi:hypothetical protein
MRLIRKSHIFVGWGHVQEIEPKKYADYFKPQAQPVGWLVVIMHAHNRGGKELSDVTAGREFRIPEHDDDLIQLQVPHLQSDAQAARLGINPVVREKVCEICVGLVWI